MYLRSKIPFTYQTSIVTPSSSYLVAGLKKEEGYVKSERRVLRSKGTNRSVKDRLQRGKEREKNRNRNIVPRWFPRQELGEEQRRT